MSLLEFLTCKDVLDEQDKAAMSGMVPSMPSLPAVSPEITNELSVLSDFLTCQSPEEHHGPAMRTSQDPSGAARPVKQNREIILTTSVQEEEAEGDWNALGDDDDDDDVESSADEAGGPKSPKSPNKVMIVVVRRDQKNNSMGVGLIP